MGIFIFGILALFLVILVALVHHFTGQLGFQKRSLKLSILSSFLAGGAAVLVIIYFRAHTPTLTAWFHEHPDKAIWLTRFFEAPLAFLVSLPAFWVVYRETLLKTALLGLTIFFVFLIL